MWTTVLGAVAMFAGGFAVTAFIVRERDKRRALSLSLSDPESPPPANLASKPQGTVVSLHLYKSEEHSGVQSLSAPRGPHGG